MGVIGDCCVEMIAKDEAPCCEIMPAQLVADALEKTARPKLVEIDEDETSSESLTPIEEISKLAHAAGALVLSDTVTSLGGCPVRLDDWQVDAVYSGTQKCLSCPPGLAPVSLSARALEVARTRKNKVQSWYLDVNLLASYWGQERVYHHTAPIKMKYALHEALRLGLVE